MFGFEGEYVVEHRQECSKNHIAYAVFLYVIVHYAGVWYGIWS